MSTPFSKLKSFAKPILRDEVHLSIKEAILTGEFAHEERISIDHHKKMIDAIKKRDMQLLKKLAQEHIQIGKEVILAEIEKGTIKL